jgi:hypothetical protein
MPTALTWIDLLASESPSDLGTAQQQLDWCGSFGTSPVPKEVAELAAFVVPITLFPQEIE